MNIVDLFCGCGGMSLGFKNAGYNIVKSFDNWEKAINIYNSNFTHNAVQLDLSKVSEAISQITEKQFDMIIGGPPCQDFSSAGKRDETLGRASLTYKFADIICSIKPKWFVMENVDRIKKSGILQDIVKKFIDNGYGLTSVILDASYCGVPQKRNRFFLIGEHSGKHNSLLPYIRNKLSKNPMTIRDYLGESLKVDYYYRHPRNYSRRGVFSIDEPSPTVRGVNRPIPKGYVKHKNDPVEVNIENIRPLTTIERSYLQTFPSSFKFEGTKTDLEQIIGNAVPVNQAKLIAESISAYIKDKNILKNENSVEFTLAQTPLHRVLK